MSDPTGRWTVAANGELFRHGEERRRLEARGAKFRSKCDTEVWTHAFADQGQAYLANARGQFAVAVWDRGERTLVLARDRFGICPLYTVRAAGWLLFASEIKALLRHPEVRREVDPAGLDQILTFPGLVSPTTMFKGIHALPPGHYLRAGHGTVQVVEYWDLVYPLAADAAPAHDERSYVDRLEELLLGAVRRRLDADVPVGFYLSGGLDSSLIGALIGKVRPDRRFHSFSITFPQADIDERRFQRLMASHLESRHHETEFPPGEIVSRLRHAIVCAETPLKESYNTCSLALSGLVRDSGHKVVVTGEGADELFAGYVGYRLDATGARAPADPGDVEAMLEDELREQLWGDPSFFYERDYLQFRDVKAGLYSDAVAADLPSFDCTRAPLVDLSKLRGRNPLHMRSYIDFKLRLADHLLADHGDRVAYANSIEARYPFLDIDIVEFARTVPPGLLVKDATEKYLLRAIARRHLPEEVAAREKFGFVAPGTPYLLSQDVEWINDLLSPETIRRQGYFNPATVERLRARFASGRASVNTTFETDFLMIVLTFGIFLEAFEMPAFGG
jgi:asparagine synthase (glutamine-hydrolysing)